MIFQKFRFYIQLANFRRNTNSNKVMPQNTELPFRENTFSVPISQRWFKISVKSGGGGHEKCISFPVHRCVNLQNNGKKQTSILSSCVNGKQ